MVKILIVEDEEVISGSLKDFFLDKGYNVLVANRGDDALDAVKKERPHLIFLDLNIPVINGMEILRLAKEFDPTIKVIIITATNDVQMMARAKELGASDYVTKPFNIEYLKDEVMDKVSAQLYEELRVSNDELRASYKRLRVIFRGITRAFAMAIDKIDHRYTYRHIERTTEYALKLREILKNEGVKDDLTEDVFVAGVVLHDVGKIFVPKEILYKRNKLDEREWEIMRRHPADGAEVIGQIEGLEELAKIILYHHERYDGKGYPKRLKGGEIPLGARISAVVDAFDAMITDRPYRKAMGIREAIEEVKQNKGTQFDPSVVDALVRLFEGGYIAKR